MCTQQEKDYLFRLKTALDRMDKESYPLQHFMFYEMCKRYQKFVCNEVDTPKIDKVEFLQLAVNAGLLNARPNGDLPDNRTLRKAFQSLVYSGYPVGATSSATDSGYGITSDTSYIQNCIREDEKRAKMLLAKTKARNIAIGFINGQMCDLDIIDMENMEVDNENDNDINQT